MLPQEHCRLDVLKTSPHRKFRSIFKNIIAELIEEKTICVACGWLRWLNVRLLVLAEVTISQFMGSSPVSGFVLTVGSLLGILSLPLALPLPYSLSLSLKINK